MAVTVPATAGRPWTEASEPATVESVADGWVEESWQGRPAVRDERLFREIMLAGHNEAREAVGAAPLRWDAQLAADAQAYARKMAGDHRFQHSAEPRGAERQGENLWVGTRLGYSYSEMVGHWLAERGNLRDGVVPDVSRTGKFTDVGHYLQIVWPETRRFGCAMAWGKGVEYLVCRYASPGNVVGARLQRPGGARQATLIERRAAP